MPTGRSTVLGERIPDRWPRIRRFLRVDATGWIEQYYHRWWYSEGRLSAEDRAAGNEEWAEFFEWHLAQRAEELAGDRIKRHLVEEWTDSMAYVCRRAAAIARGEDPGEWIPQRVRRPDMHAERKAITDGIVAGLAPRREPETPLHKAV